MQEYRIIVPNFKCDFDKAKAKRVTASFNSAVKHIKPDRIYYAFLSVASKISDVEHTERPILATTIDRTLCYIADFKDEERARSFHSFISKECDFGRRYQAPEDRIFTIGWVPEDETEEDRAAMGFHEFNIEEPT